MQVSWITGSKKEVNCHHFLIHNKLLCTKYDVGMHNESQHIFSRGILHKFVRTQSVFWWGNERWIIKPGYTRHPNCVPFCKTQNIFVLKRPSKRLLLAFEFNHLWLINFSLIARFRSGFFGGGVLGTLKEMPFLSPEVR